ncbi:GNAT family N-acetyltransferase [Fodinicurvata halophila]|uniref:GNAT family N-acetyltransferase n=1 Tax=Fodinicurvata halophila TaxID=1419723 RepID=A0ABV8UN55_9PROT
MIIRNERRDDVETISRLVTEAFQGAAHSDGNEADIVAGLRRAGALAVSLVAEEADDLVGHIAFSPVRIGPSDTGWFGLGPISVRPDRQEQGIGAALVRAGLARLEANGGAGCVLLGDPGYYARFGFRSDPELVMEGVPPDFFLVLPLAGPVPRGTASYHPAFFPG